MRIVSSPAPGRPRPRTAGQAAAALVLLLAALAGCGGDEGRDGAGRGAPGIVLLCVDTLRADAFERPEGKPGRMPALASFAGGATAFADASAASSWTAPSIATLLTGLEPARTGVRGTMETAGALAGSVTTLAEALQARGWSTYAATAGGWVVSQRGYAQGFESFEETFDTAGPKASIEAWSSRRRPGVPFFLFLHTYEAHGPYGPKGPGAPEVAEQPEVSARAKALWQDAGPAGSPLPKATMAWFLDHLLSMKDIRALEKTLPPEAIGDLINRGVEWMEGEGRGTPELAAIIDRARELYRLGTTDADAVVQETLTALYAAHVPPDTVVAIVGDHGEGLGEHGMLFHGRWLYDELLRVPLIVRAPGRLPAGAVVSGSCGLVDVMPTLLALAGVSPPGHVDGRSLLPLVRGEEHGHAVFAEEERWIRPGGVARPLRIVSARTAAAKTVITFDERTGAVEGTETYDLAADPGERAPLPADSPKALPGDFRAAVERLRASIARDR